MNFIRDEFRHGREFAGEEEIAAFDRQMHDLRRIDDENRNLLELSGIGYDSAVLEIGTGTGDFACAAGKVCRRVKALSVSPGLLEYARKKAEGAEVHNVAFERAGFLNFDAPDASFDVVVSSHALHTLPDHWKAVALRKIRHWLRRDGVFVLCDIVYDWGMRSPEEYFADLVKNAGSPESAAFLANHIANEYSPTAWIMQTLLSHAGFEIVSETRERGFLSFYKCI